MWLSMNCLVLDPKTVIVRPQEVWASRRRMDKLGMNVIPVDLRGRLRLRRRLHCSCGEHVYREASASTTSEPRRRPDPGSKPEMWNDQSRSLTSVTDGASSLVKKGFGLQGIPDPLFLFIIQLSRTNRSVM